jgi:hypothetical protein
MGIDPAAWRAEKAARVARGESKIKASMMAVVDVALEAAEHAVDTPELPDDSPSQEAPKE